MNLDGLTGVLRGEARFDRARRLLYSTDASIYQEEPLGVAFPLDEADLRALVRFAGERRVPLIPRAAGTSLAGQCVGAGLVVDLSRHFTRIESLDPTVRRAVVQPGVIQDSLNAAARPHGLQFGPDTATSDRCMLGGMIGNNSCGAHSILYGATRDHVRWVDAVLSDGAAVRFENLEPDELAAKTRLESLEGRCYRVLQELLATHRDAIFAAYPAPEVVRRNTGYALDELARCRPFTPDGPPFNLCKLLCGSEGTLAFVARACVDLVPLPAAKGICVGHFETVAQACQATLLALEHAPAAAELIDATILNAAQHNTSARQAASVWQQGEPGAVLAVEFFGDSVEQCREKGLAFAEACRAAKLGYAHPWLDGAAQQAVWQVRKAGLGLLMGVPGDRKSTTLIEDAAVPVKHLPAYRQAIEDLLREHGADACYYAHASVGLLHIRPNLNLRTREGREAFSSIASRAADLVKQYRGSLSGEHGDGRLRAPFIEKVLGSEMLALLRQVKQAFDPEGLFNPGKILDPKPLTADWRVSPEKPPPDLPTVFDWSASYGLVRAVEKCNGAGVCRKLPGSGGMCPSYHATLDELHTTRGRANLLRQLLEQGPDQAWTAPELAEALEWCLSCKACQSECPSSVDLARLKAEALQQRYDREGVPRQALLFADFAGQAARTQWLPGLVSVANAAAGTRALKWLLGVDPRRAIPPFAARTFSAWWKTRPPGPRGGKRVALLVDLFTEYQEPGLGQAAVNVLEAGGFQVEAVGPLDDGRTWLSQGLVRRAKEKLDAALVRLRAYIEAGVPLVGLEPSTTLTFRDEGPDLATDRGLSKNAAQAVRLFDEFLVQEAAAFAGVFRAEKDRTVWVHGHCHQKALASTASTLNALRLVPGWDVKEIASGCCGMAGSFGYKHYELSMRIGELQLFPAVRAAGAADVLCASGTSCRHQIRDGTQRRAWHLAELLAKQI